MNLPSSGCCGKVVGYDRTFGSRDPFRLTRRHQIEPGVLQTALQLFSLHALVLNGRIISHRGRPLDPDTLCRTINELLSGTDR